MKNEAIDPRIQCLDTDPIRLAKGRASSTIHRRMTQLILTVPPSFSTYLSRRSRYADSLKRELSQLTGTTPFVTADPRERRLGSGGGTVRALHQAWLSSGSGSLKEWLSSSKHVVLHAGGESRRLPAFCGVGKTFIPMPPSLGLQPQALGASLANYQVPTLARCLERAGKGAAVLVASGDVWLDFDPSSVSPSFADIVGVGMRVSPALAQHFGVYFVKRGAVSGIGAPVEVFKQKPPVAEINERGRELDALVDTGIWMLSVECVLFLFRLCGWDEHRQRFATPKAEPQSLDLYSEIGNALGRKAVVPENLKDAGFQRLTSTVIGVSNARFHHLGSNRQLLESCEDIAQSRGGRLSSFTAASTSHLVEATERLPIWVSNSRLSAPLHLAGDNLVSGLRPRCSVSRLSKGQCIDLIPVAGNAFALRPYHIDDSCRGRPSSGGKICGREGNVWAHARGLKLADEDVFNLKIYPVLPESKVSQAWLEWFFDDQPSFAKSSEYAALKKISASEVADVMNYSSFFAHQLRGQICEAQFAFQRISTHGETEILDTDGGRIAQILNGSEVATWLGNQSSQIASKVHSIEKAARFKMLLAELATEELKPQIRKEGFSMLQTALVRSHETSASASNPTRNLKEDQIVWARSPVRLDLSGGWTDTPPYCLENGGCVLNMAVYLNGQPPIQAFVRQTKEKTLSIRSIDQGASEVVKTFTELADFRNPKGNFSLPKAAFALAGFLPEFKKGTRYRTLAKQLEDFGGGIEISMLSAVPKGSGLGTSSILGATLLAGLNRACGLGWDEIELYNRVLSVEQLLTTGGGWQDQAGAIFPSVKLIETSPGMDQRPRVKYLPTQLFSRDIVNRRLLLYYTGITRMAKGILQEIVQAMFLGKSSTLRTLSEIRANTEALYRAIQSGESRLFDDCIARSWKLNNELDSGTSTPAVEEIIDRCGADLSACKLLGAGGGGYMLLCAKDDAAGMRIRDILEKNPPNPRARFIDFNLAEKGVEVTVS